MNPYTPPTQQADADGYDHETLLELSDHPLYAFVLRMVLWGEKREDVYRSLEVNGITGGMADRLYAHAMADRIRTIRSDCTRKLLIGVGLVVAAVVTFSLCWFGLGFIPRFLLCACFVALGIGSWKSIDGAAGYLMATARTGSVTEET
ncbi:MAG: hypothetical protein ABIT37_08925 [Luteolibacter sp.]